MCVFWACIVDVVRLAKITIDVRRHKGALRSSLFDKIKNTPSCVSVCGIFGHHAAFYGFRDQFRAQIVMRVIWDYFSMER